MLFDFNSDMFIFIYFPIKHHLQRTSHCHVLLPRRVAALPQQTSASIAFVRLEKLIESRSDELKNIMEKHQAMPWMALFVLRHGRPMDRWIKSMGEYDIWHRSINRDSTERSRTMTLDMAQTFGIGLKWSKSSPTYICIFICIYVHVYTNFTCHIYT